MKKLIKAASGSSKVKIVYARGLDTFNPELRSMTVVGSDSKEVLMGALNVLDLHYLGLDFNEPDSFSFGELVDAIVYQNGQYAEDDYIFSLDIDGQNYIDETGPEENYRAEEVL